MSITPNLNLGALNGSLEHISGHMPAMAGTKTIYIRNYTNKYIEFGASAYARDQFNWFTTEDNSTVFVKKPPMPVLCPGVSTSIIVHTTAGGSPVTNKFQFVIDDLWCELFWKFGGYRKLVFNDNVIYETNEKNRAFTRNIMNDVLVSSICGYDVWTLDIHLRQNNAAIDMNL